ncbi:META domain-containing protein [Marinobacter salinisoli]|uniref:META domain-containing protein n=1 Tax=Marinobacter salinisoli TaxID=2769486 RepID=A0ABX7MV22_9GAMM|nr:META domain-containing protein [Marinobacter salinisoli]QSP95234.1 META domain-containing protein [Marinobacter salinisoli]
MRSRYLLAVPVVATLGLLLSACQSTPETQFKAENTYACGQLNINVLAAEDNPLLTIEYLNQQLLLKPAESDGGELYVAPGNESTRFLRTGETALLTIRGQQYPECLPPGAIEMPFRAAGNEPYWQARVIGDELIVDRPLEEKTTLRLPAKLSKADRHGRQFVAAGDGMNVTLTVARQLCQDTMSGAQYPNQAWLALDDIVYGGCGGNPERLYLGAEWIVGDLAKTEPLDRSRMTITFLNGNRIAGMASCNRYSGTYLLDGEGGVDFSQLISSRMACSPELMLQEDRFLELLDRVSSIRIGRFGELLLTTREGEMIKAFPSDMVDPTLE